jgi:hypothetical protein
MKTVHAIKGQWVDAHGTKHLKVFVPTVDAQVDALRRYDALRAQGMSEADAMSAALGR